MVMELYGLRLSVESVDSLDSLDATAVGPGIDLVWQRQTVERLTERDPPAFFKTTQPDGVWMHHAYGLPGETRCEFAISPDGGRVISRALASVLEADLLALFAEPVMRSVFRALGVVSFHGAALEREGAAILLLGSKGAGKSTLAAMLLQQGWSLLTDDLARVRENGGGWGVAPGFRQLKVSPETAAALGLDTAKLERRWSAPEAPDDPVTNKFVLTAARGAGQDVPLRAIYLVGPRGEAGAPVRIEAVAPVMRLSSLVQHVSEDPVWPGRRPPREAIEAAVALVRCIEVKTLSLPHGLGRTLDFAAL